MPPGIELSEAIPKEGVPLEFLPLSHFPPGEKMEEHIGGEEGIAKEGFEHEKKGEE